MKRVVSAVLAAVTVVGAVWVAVPVDRAVAAVVLAAPTGVVVTPGVGRVTVSWNPVGAAQAAYAVTSAPPGKSCSTLTTSCTIPSTTSVPYTFTVTASAPGSVTSPPSAPTVALSPHLVLVVAGQSNANGYESYATDLVTHIDYLAPPYTNGADTHDLLTWLPWSELQGSGAAPVALDAPQQIVSGTTTLTIFGPEIGLARQLWTDTGRSVTVVKGAYTGTSLAVNWNPTSTGAPPNGLVAGLVDKVDAVMASDAAAGRFDVLGGIYWYQGESDATVSSHAKRYQANLASLIRAFRADLAIAPTAPVVLAEEDVTQYIDYLNATDHLPQKQFASYLRGNAEVRAADVWAAANLPDVVTVDSAGLARVAPEYVHLDNVAQLALGAQLAKVSEHLLP